MQDPRNKQSVEANENQWWMKEDGRKYNRELPPATGLSSRES
ncbi:hypothetical protein RISK_006009 [Rhodopirellula islandica]|uniref:Uncharacterized protein n=1 Tax=Rhodopirellula islandica TaxID=595434 RepID=A0A0J1B4P5_RHOIS|nr:hypothetical protein RISK_006009 [Rhodopirellula islandica]